MHLRSSLCLRTPALRARSALQCAPRPRLDGVARRQLCSKASTPAADAAAAGAAATATAATAAAAETAAAAAPVAEAAASGGYGAFARAYPITNNFIIATCKTSAADLLAQMGIEKKSFSEVNWQRNAVFCLFGFAYLGGFQYWYQVNIFKRLFPSVERFTSQSISAKLTDVPGLISLAGQTVLDLGMLTCVYLPTFYVFKAAVFSDVVSPPAWVEKGIGNYTTNISKDAYDIVRVWAPADIVCFSVPASMSTGAVIAIGCRFTFSGSLNTPMYRASEPNGVPSLELPQPLE